MKQPTRELKISIQIFHTTHKEFDLLKKFLREFKVQKRKLQK